MAIPIIHDWRKYYITRHEGMGSSYERIILNRKLHFIQKHYQIRTVIETPSFGFTGISGINSMNLAKNACQVTLEDHDPERLKLIHEIWNEVGLPVTTRSNGDYSALDHPDKSFDLAWNFSALWFVSSLPAFLSELSRIASKVILLCIPNQMGWGFRMQMKDADPASLQDIHIENLSQPLICRTMQGLGWKLVETDYIDCPPWPDIGTSKEEFLMRHDWLRAILSPFVTIRKNTEGSGDANGPPLSLSILKYYNGSDPSFPDRMLRHSWFERIVPSLVKRFWAHHRYLLFTPDPDDQSFAMTSEIHP